MTIDWAAIDGNYNTDNYNERLGLTEGQARELVLAFGLKWNSDPGAPIEFISQQAQEWWEDFANSRDYYLRDSITGDPDENRKNHWAEISLYIMYQRITRPHTGSGQIHLLFNPELFENLDGQDYSHLYNSETGAFVHPGTGEALTNLGYYDDLFFEEMLTTGMLTVMGEDHWINGLFYQFLESLIT